jgi:hypothetical protein
MCQVMRRTWPTEEQRRYSCISTVFFIFVFSPYSTRCVCWLQVLQAIKAKPAVVKEEQADDLENAVDADGRRPDGTLVFTNSTEFTTRLQARLNEKARHVSEVAVKDQVSIYQNALAAFISKCFNERKQTRRGGIVPLRIILLHSMTWKSKRRKMIWIRVRTNKKRKSTSTSI